MLNVEKQFEHSISPMNQILSNQIVDNIAKHNAFRL